MITSIKHVAKVIFHVVGLFRPVLGKVVVVVTLVTLDIRTGGTIRVCESNGRANIILVPHFQDECWEGIVMECTFYG
jgi:hypothetical protein